MRLVSVLLLCILLSFASFAQPKMEGGRLLDSVEAKRLDSLVNDRGNHLVSLSCDYRIEMSNKFLQNAFPSVGHISLNEDSGMLITLGPSQYVKMQKGKMTIKMGARTVSIDMDEDSTWGKIFNATTKGNSKKVGKSNDTEMKDSVLEYQHQYLYYLVPRKVRRKPAKKDMKYQFMLIDKADYSLNGFGTMNYGGEYMRIYFSNKQVKYGAANRPKNGI